MSKKGILLCAVVCTAALMGCSSESTSSTSMNVSVETDGGVTEYSYSSENNNGKVTTQSSTSTTLAENEKSEASEEASGVLADIEEEAYWLDDLLTEKWDDNTQVHDVSYDKSGIYCQVWGTGAVSKDNISEDEFRKEVIPSWQDSVVSWKDAWKEDGLNDSYVCFQYLFDDGEKAVFTVEDSELTYFVFD